MSLKSCEKTGTNEVTIELSISAEAFADANVKAYNKVKKNITVPGFRKGKAPLYIIEARYGKEVFFEYNEGNHFGPLIERIEKAITNLLTDYGTDRV